MSSAADLSSICQRCGLCCDGTLFPVARLAPEEVEPAKKNGLVIFNQGDAQGAELPCARFDRATCGCTIYDQRPRTCRGFECTLLARARTGDMPVAAALATIDRTKQLIAMLKEKGMDMTPRGPRTVSGSGDDAYEIFGLVSELMTRLTSDFAAATDDEGTEG